MKHIHDFSEIYLEYNTDILLGESIARTVQNNMFIIFLQFDLI